MAEITGNVSGAQSLTGAVSGGENLSGNISGSGSMTGGVQQGFPREHSELNGRNLPDQHPESAITGLAADLAARPSTVISDAEIMAL